MGINRNQSLFIVGLLIRILLIMFLVPVIQQVWFIPFLKNVIAHPGINPWASFMVSHGNLLSFPYGPTMLAAYLPGQLVATCLFHLTHINSWYVWLFGFTTIIFDYFLMKIIHEITQCDYRKVLWYYWLSPIVIYICYWHGQLDILPVMLLFLALLYLIKGEGFKTGVFLAFSFSAKLSMLIAAPLIAIYLWRNNRVKLLCKPFFLGLTLVFFALQVPFLLSRPFDQMVFGNPQFDKITLFSFQLGSAEHIYLLPLLYILFVYFLWKMERISQELLVVLLGISFLIVLVLTPASIGWYLWILPFVVIHQIKASSKVETLLITSFSVLFVLFGILFQAGVNIPEFHLNLVQPLVVRFVPSLEQIQSYWATTSSIFLATISLSMFVKGIKNNDYFRLSRKPLAIGIAGDSGSGKDTLSVAIAGMFNASSVTSISGDDYHKWDRYSPIWQHLTHLDPRANELQRFARDTFDLLNGKNIFARTYDHSTGRFTKALSFKKNDVIIVSGLHALYHKQLRKCYVLSIYLLMDEELRKFYKLKRDVNFRGRSPNEVLESIVLRASDAKVYLMPQIKHADIVFKLEAVNPTLLQDFSSEELPKLRLKAEIKNAIYYEELTRYLVGLCGLYVDSQISKDGSRIELTIEGEILSEDVLMIAKHMVPYMDQLLAFSPKWEANILGLMQLIVLLNMSEALHSRLLT